MQFVDLDDGTLSNQLGDGKEFRKNSLNLMEFANQTESFIGNANAQIACIEKLFKIENMDWLNYHHLLYFWVVAREGSITKACELLHLAQPTISGQLKSLETALGEKLFHRNGKQLTLTETGKLVYRYADEIFSLGQELTDALKGKLSARPHRLTIGIVDAMPKLIAYRLLQPARDLPQPVQIVCREDSLDRLLGELTVHNLDIVFSDLPAGPSTKGKVFNHQLGECGITFCGVNAFQDALADGFPLCLEGAPLLLPTEHSALRRMLDGWFDTLGIRPEVVGEFDDTALLKVFGQAGDGIFPVPTVIEQEVCRQYDVEIIGRCPNLKERFFAVSVERRLKHPAVIAICEAAQQQLFATGSEEVEA